MRMASAYMANSLDCASFARETVFHRDLMLKGLFSGQCLCPLHHLPDVFKVACNTQAQTHDSDFVFPSVTRDELIDTLHLRLHIEEACCTTRVTHATCAERYV